MSKLHFIKPYDDDKLHYDEESGVYELTPAFVKEEFDINLVDDATIGRRIKQNSRVVYRYIYANGNSFNANISKMMINKTEEGRKFIFECLREQYDADNENGYNDLGKQTPIDLVGNRNVDRYDLRRNLISVNTESIIDNSASYFGISIVYQAPYPVYFQLLYKSYGA